MRTILTLTALTLPLVASAQTSHEMHMAMTTSTTVNVSATDTIPASTEAFMVANTSMHTAMMAAPFTGDADVDFLRGMIPHHQGAVDMANIVLKYGTDPEIRMLAGDIIKAQENEIRVMKAWLAKHGPTETASPTVMLDGLPRDLTPKMPAPSEAISNTSPKMDMLSK